MKKIFKWLKRSYIGFILAIIKRWLKARPNILFGEGVHFITAPSGGGKTLLSNFIIRTITGRYGGFFWVNMNQYDEKITETFDLDKLIQKGEQKYRLNKEIEFNGGKKYSRGVVVDELNARFNRRMNKTAEYNLIFIPLVKFVVTHRHAGHNRIYLLGQFNQDTQIMEVLKYKHIVSPSKGYFYYYWKEKEKLVLAPKKLLVESFIRSNETDASGNYIWYSANKQKIKVTVELLETYNTHAFEEIFKDLPLYKS